MEVELRRDLAASTVAATRLQAQVIIAELERNRWRVTIVTHGATGRNERKLEGDNCAALVSATSLIIATLIDPEAAAQPPPRSHPQQAETTAAIRPDASASGLDSTPTLQSLPPGRSAGSPRPSGPLAADVAKASPPVLSRQSAFVGGWAGLDYGSLPSVTQALQGLMGWDAGWARVEATLGWWRPQDKSWAKAPEPAAGGRFGMVAAALRGCTQAYHWASFRLLPCVGLEARSLTGRANSLVDEPGQVTRRGLAPVLGTLGNLSLSRGFALRTSLELVFPLDRPVFTIDGLGHLHQPGRLAFRSGIGLELHFP